MILKEGRATRVKVDYLTRGRRDALFTLNNTMQNSSKYEFIGSIEAEPATITQNTDPQTEFADLARQMIAVQTRQNELLQQILVQLGLAQRQRTLELAQWRRAHPRLARSCKIASERLEKIQTEILSNLAAEIDENSDDLLEQEYVLSEFFDKYGSRIIHLNSIMQTLTTLGNAPEFPER